MELRLHGWGDRLLRLHRPELEPGEGRVLRLRVTPGTTGYVAPEIVLTSANIPGAERRIPYTAITDDVQVLVVDDDGNQPYQSYYESALHDAGVSVGVWPAGICQVTSTN